MNAIRGIQMIFEINNISKTTIIQRLLFNNTLQIIKKMNMNSVSAVNSENELSTVSNAVAGICHMRSINNKQSNFEQVEQIVKLAKQKSVKFLFLPECCDFVGENRDETIQLSEPLTGPTVKNYKNLAKTNQIWLSFGGLHELILDSNGESTGKVYNTHLVINDLGDIVATYRKLHLFDVNTPEFKFRESKVVSKGEEIIKPIRTPIGNVGLQICYDLRFPEVSLILRRLGAEILTYPSAFAYSTGKAHWEVLLRARAIENQCYVIAPAQIGFHNSKRQSYGNAIIINPWGEIIASCNNDCDIDVATAEIDLENLYKVRQNMPCFDHKRDDIYSLHSFKLSQSITEDRKFSEHLIQADTIFYESEYCFCFTNLRCVVPGHVLVATKRQVKRVTELQPAEVTDLFQTVVKIEKYLEKFHNSTSATVTVQDGIHAGQTVEHVHFHIMPRHKDDFEFNDEIYIRLRMLDKNPIEKPRTWDEMVEEAKQYRKFIKDNPL